MQLVLHKSILKYKTHILDTKQKLSWRWALKDAQMLRIYKGILAHFNNTNNISKGLPCRRYGQLGINGHLKFQMGAE